MSEIIGFTDWSWVLGLLGLIVAFLIYGYVNRQPAGNEMMVDLAEQIHDGAMAFLKREYIFLLDSPSASTPPLPTSPGP